MSVVTFLIRKRQEKGSHNTREGYSPLSLIGGGSSSFLPFSFVVVTALLLLSSTFSLACIFGGVRFSLVILSHSLSCGGGGFAFLPLQKQRKNYTTKRSGGSRTSTRNKLKKRATTSDPPCWRPKLGVQKCRRRTRKGSSDSCSGWGSSTSQSSKQWNVVLSEWFLEMFIHEWRGTAEQAVVALL